MENPSATRISTFRRVLPQVLAGVAINLLSFGYGLYLSFPSIVIAALHKDSPDESIHMTSAEISWLASITYFGSPLGNIAGGIINEPFGRKRTTLLVNIPRILGWLMLAFGNSATYLYISFALLGFSDGLMGIPLSLYIVDISEPSMRGSLQATGGILASIGFFVTFAVGAVLPWRQVAWIGLCVPVVAFAAILLIPESPRWLLAKQRPNEALKSLQWLRGWDQSETVSYEFMTLKRHTELSKSCAHCEKEGIECMHPRPNICEKLKKAMRKRTLKPFMMILILQFFMQFSGMSAIRPYVKLVINAHGMPLNEDFSAILLSILGFLAIFAIALSVRVLGKRKIFLVSLAASFLTYFALSIYGFAFFPSGWSAFDKNIDPNQIRELAGNWSYFALAMFLINYFFFCFGVSCIPNFLPSEVFSLELRSFCCVAMSVLGQLLELISTKSFYNFDVWLSLQGAICLCGVICLIAFFVAYLILPETENRSLEEIEAHFSNDRLGFTDINIHRNH